MVPHTTYLISPFTVDDLERCNSMVGREEKSIMNSTHHTGLKQGGKPSMYFPFKQGYLAITTLRVALEGIHMTVDGKHITSFAYRAVIFSRVDHEINVMLLKSLESEFLLSGLGTLVWYSSKNFW